CCFCPAQACTPKPPATSPPPKSRPSFASRSLLFPAGYTATAPTRDPIIYGIRCRRVPLMSTVRRKGPIPLRKYREHRFQVSRGIRIADQRIYPEDLLYRSQG